MIYLIIEECGYTMCENYFENIEKAFDTEEKAKNYIVNTYNKKQYNEKNLYFSLGQDEKEHISYRIEKIIVE